jgi:hypothetical protein
VEISRCEDEGKNGVMMLVAHRPPPLISRPNTVGFSITWLGKRV